MATRSFSPDAEVVERGGQAARHRGELRVGEAAEAAAGRVRLVDHRLAVAVDELGALEEVGQRERNDHWPSVSPTLSLPPGVRVTSPRWKP